MTIVHTVAIGCAGDGRNGDAVAVIVSALFQPVLGWRWFTDTVVPITTRQVGTVGRRCPAPVMPPYRCHWGDTIVMPMTLLPAMVAVLCMPTLDTVRPLLPRKRGDSATVAALSCRITDTRSRRATERQGFVSHGLLPTGELLLCFTIHVDFIHLTGCFRA